jgi:hypothetical protein
VSYIKFQVSGLEAANAEEEAGKREHAENNQRAASEAQKDSILIQ